MKISIRKLNIYKAKSKPYSEQNKVEKASVRYVLYCFTAEDERLSKID